MEKLSDLLEMAKVSDIIATKKEKEDNKIVWALAIIGAIEQLQESHLRYINI